jgi:hypothetical protein
VSAAHLPDNALDHIHVAVASTQTHLAAFLAALGPCVVFHSHRERIRRMRRANASGIVRLVMLLASSHGRVHAWIRVARETITIKHESRLTEQQLQTVHRVE